MNSGIRILHIDDNLHDRELVRDALIQESDEFEIVSIENREQFELLIREENFDIVLSDFNILGFDGLQVLEVIQALSPDTPVIIVTGTGSEEIAIKALKMGAADYVIKTVKHIRGLAPAIKSVLYRKELLKEKERAIEALKLSEEKYRMLHNSMMDGYVFTDMNGKIKEFNETYRRMLGYETEELLQLNYIDLTPEKWHKYEMKIINEQILPRGYSEVYEKEYRRKDGTIFPVELRVFLLRNDAQGNIGMWAIARDITQRKLSEKALEESRQALNRLIDNLHGIVYRCKYIPGRTLEFISKGCYEITGFEDRELLNGQTETHWNGFITENDRQRTWNEIRDKVEKKMPYTIEYKIKHTNGEEKYLWEKGCGIYDDKEQPVALEGFIVDITERIRMNETLKKERKLLRTLVDNLPDAIYTKDSEGRKLIANKADLKIMGYHTEDEAIGKTDIEIYGQQKGIKGYNEDMSVINTGQAILNYEDSWQDAEGKIHWRLISKIPLFDEHGKVIGLVGIGHDITEQKMAQQTLIFSERKFREIFNSTSEAIFINDAATRRLIDCNDRALEIFGYSSKEEIMAGIAEGMNSDIEPFTEKIAHEHFNKAIKEGPQSFEWQARKKNGETFWAEASLKLSEVTGKKAVISVVRDITERKMASEQLKIAKEKAEESDRLKTAFLHNISHEIRTPMNAIVGFSELLSHDDLMPEKRRYYADILIKSSDRLLSIITDIINIATIEAGQEKLYEKDTDINALCKQIFTLYSRKVNEAGISLQYKTYLPDNEAVILADGTKLFQVLSNLVDNAIKFTPKGHIHYGYKVNQGYLEFYVEDTGIGIEPGMSEEIFKRFRQVEITEDRRQGGSGLGLSIAKAYIELMGGRNRVKALYFISPYPLRKLRLKMIPVLINPGNQSVN